MDVICGSTQRLAELITNDPFSTTTIVKASDFNRTGLLGGKGISIDLAAQSLMLLWKDAR
jgi:hypothetical protein